MEINQSRISKVLSDLTIKKIVIVVLLLMIIIPLFDNTAYVQKTQSWDFITMSIHKALKSPDVPTSTIVDMVNYMISVHQGDNYILYFSSPFNQLPYYRHDRFGKERISDITSSIESMDMDLIMYLNKDLTLRPDLPTT